MLLIMFPGGTGWRRPIVKLLFVAAICFTGTRAQFCSFFGNKSPSPQPGLQNCTWYRERSCCVNEEINSLFSQVQVPANSNGNCRNYITYLMCYVCDPKQSSFYERERLTVCEDFCDDVLSACQDAVLKGVRLGTYFGMNGSAFCEARRFRVSNQKETCFALEKSKRTLVASSSLAQPSIILALLLPLFLVANGLRTSNGGVTSILLVTVVTLVLCSGRSDSLVDDNGIKTMASRISSTLTSTANTGIRREDLQGYYDGASSQQETLNVTRILLIIKQKLEALTNDLDTASQEIRNAVISARRSAISDTTPSPTVSSLPSSVFLDADSIFDRTALDVQYNSTFLRHVSFQQSAVKIPDDVIRDTKEVYDAIDWSASIDTALKKLQTRRNARWAYFGSETGVYRIYPAAEWTTNFAGFSMDYDPRFRPWYLSATSGPKLVGIFLDCSTSMSEKGRWHLAKQTIRQILNSLSRDDKVSLICSRGHRINNGGRQERHYSKVLGCQKNKMMRATGTNVAQLLEELDNERPIGSGESHSTSLSTLISLFPTSVSCQKVLIFVTDGKDRDSEAFKNVCWDKNRGSHGCNLLRTDFNGLYKQVESAHNSKSLHVIGIEVGNEGSTLPGTLACENQGVYIRINTTANLRTRLRPYFSYLARLVNTESAVIRPTAPYVDASGLGRIITLSRVVYDPQDQRKLLGVVGVDAVLDDVENTLLDDQFGLSYAFLIDTEGRAIVHPRLKPGAELLDDPVYPHISSLEVYQGAPAQFSATNGILSEMVAQKTGKISVIGPRPQQKGGLQDGVVWTSNVAFTYHYSAATTTQYAFAFVLTDHDATQVVLPNVAAASLSYYHEIGKYSSMVATTIGRTKASTKYPNLEVAELASSFKLGSQAFCDPTRYLLSDVPNFTTIDVVFNTNDVPTMPSCDNGGDIVPETRSTVRLTQPIEAVWKARPASITDEIVWTYFGSANGVWRSFPGSRSTRSYDPTRRPWYHRALANPPSQYATSSVYLDAGGIGKVVTLAQTVFQTRSMSPTGACSQPNNRAGNCQCTAHSQCQSMYCYGTTPTTMRCANPQVAGVAAIDFRYNQFAGAIETALAANTLQTDRCTDENIRCVLVNDAAEVVYDRSFASAVDGDPRSYENMPLAYLNGAIMLDLLDRGVFERISFRHLQGTCQIAPYAPRASDRDLILSADQQDRYYEMRGPIPRFQNDYGCPTDQVQYQRKHTFDFTSSLSASYQGPCANGNYRVHPVADTNLLLLSIETTNNKSSNFFNFNCHIFNNVARSGGFESKEVACGGDVADGEVTVSCPAAVDYVPTCSFDSAGPLSFSPLLIALLAVWVTCWSF